MIKLVLADMDDTLFETWGVLRPGVAAMLRLLKRYVKLGVATGKGKEYAFPFASAAGFLWDIMGVSSGAVFCRLTDEGPPAQYETYALPRSVARGGKTDLGRFVELVRWDPYSELFLLEGKLEPFTPELKTGVVVFHPVPGKAERSVLWQAYFNRVISEHGLSLEITQFNDGCIDVKNRGVNKRLIVLESCRVYGCEPEEILVAVDGQNDVPLFVDGVKIIVVGNATSEVKALALERGGYVATRKFGLGFCEGIRHFARQGLLPVELIG